MDIQKNIAQIEELKNQVRQHIQQVVIQLPDNPRIERFSKNPSCFVLSSKDFGDCWDAEYHDFYGQYRKISSWLESQQPEQMLNMLRTIVNQGCIWKDKRNHRFHPDVIEHLRGMNIN